MDRKEIAEAFEKKGIKVSAVQEMHDTKEMIVIIVERDDLERAAEFGRTLGVSVKVPV